MILHLLKHKKIYILYPTFFIFWLIDEKELQALQDKLLWLFI